MGQPWADDEALPGKTFNPQAPRHIIRSMRFHGTYRDGVIVPVEQLPVPEGAEVDFDLSVAQTTGNEGAASIDAAPAPSMQSLRDILMSCAGTATDPALPGDGAFNHDHYIYGTPKLQPRQDDAS